MKKLIILAAFLLLFPVVSHADCTVVVGGVAASETCTAGTGSQWVNTSVADYSYATTADKTDSYQTVAISSGSYDICAVQTNIYMSTGTGNVGIVICDTDCTTNCTQATETAIDAVSELKTFNFPTDSTRTDDFAICVYKIDGEGNVKWKMSNDEGDFFGNSGSGYVVMGGATQTNDFANMTIHYKQ